MKNGASMIRSGLKLEEKYQVAGGVAEAYKSDKSNGMNFN